jgi:peroxiredoxin
MDEMNEREVDRMIEGRFSSFRADGDWQPDVQRGLGVLRQRRAAAEASRRRWLVLASAAAAICVAILAFPMTRAFAEHLVSTCVQQTAEMRKLLIGRPSGATSTTYVKPGDRRMAPDFTLADALGHGIRLSDSRGKVVLLSFWATSCAPCEQEIPWFVEFQRTNAQRGFAVLGISMDVGGWETVTPYVEQKNVNYPVLMGNDELAGLFGGKYFPMPLTLILDRSGRIAAIHAGLCRKDEYESDINTVLAEKER